MREQFQSYASPIVLDWPRRWRDIHGECPSAKLRELNKIAEHSIYWDNTVKFAEYSRRNHDWHLRPEEN